MEQRMFYYFLFVAFSLLVILGLFTNLGEIGSNMAADISSALKIGVV
jgi:hypothetical protein